MSFSVKLIRIWGFLGVTDAHSR